MRKFYFSVVVILFIFCLGCIHYRNSLNVNQETNLRNSLDIIDTKVGDYTMAKGTSFPIGDGYQLALTHATNGPAFAKYFIKDREIELVGIIGDISLFKKSWKADYPFTLGEDPIVGTELVMLGNSMLNVRNTKLGIVSALGIGKYGKEDIDFKNSFLHTIPTNPGDSGSPALARNLQGEYEVVGIVNAGIMQAQGYNMAIKVSYMKEVIDAILNGTSK